MLRNCNDTGIMQRQEKKVTVTVLAIVTCFTITHVSLQILIYSLLLNLCSMNLIIYLRSAI